MSNTKILNHYFPGAGSVKIGAKPVILFADVDGTLVDDTMRVSSKDAAAIKKLMDEGHFFTLATGRGRTNAEFHMNSQATNFPAIFSNGALFYDRSREEAIKQFEMSSDDLGELFAILTDFYPEIMIQIYTQDAIYLITDNPPDDPRVENHQPYQRIAFNQLKGVPCNKVLFGMQDENCDEGRDLALNYVNSHGINLRVVKSQSKYLELTPCEVSKGNMLEFVKAEADAIIAVAGDYYNDIEMMQAADIAYTLSSAPNEVKDVADVIIDSVPGEFISLVIQDLLDRSATNRG
ncbi:MAG: HAD-IIB family hydrolase [Clostridiaceae bacterium]